MQGEVRVTFSWKYSPKAKNVVLLCSDTGWDNPLQMENLFNEGIWYLTRSVILPVQYKFRVDGVWEHDLEKPSTGPNEMRNNIIDLTIEKFASKLKVRALGETISRWRNRPFSSDHMILVLGAPVAEGPQKKPIPGPDMQARLDLCLKLFTAHGGAFPIIVTGGAYPTYGSSGTKAEGLVMKEYLVETCGLDPSLIYTETTAYHTLDNLLESKRIIDQNQWQPKKLLIISHDFHMERVKFLATKIFEDTQIELSYEAIISDHTNPKVLERIESETVSMKLWVPSIFKLERYFNHDQFPRAVPYLHLSL